jgi:hypothetical protein
VSAQVGEDDAVSACGKGVCVPVIEPLAAGGEEPVEEQDGWAGADLAIGEPGTVAAGVSTDRWFDRPAVKSASVSGSVCTGVPSAKSWKT